MQNVRECYRTVHSLFYFREISIRRPSVPPAAMLREHQRIRKRRAVLNLPRHSFDDGGTPIPFLVRRNLGEGFIEKF